LGNNTIYLAKEQESREFHVDKREDIVAAFIIGGVLLASGVGWMIASDNAITAYMSLLVIGFPGAGTFIYGINLLLKSRKQR
jgi:hypothetical protein